jgi:hypothetical protein
LFHHHLELPEEQIASFEEANPDIQIELINWHTFSYDTALHWMKRELIGLNVLFMSGFSDQLLRQFTAFDLSNHPANDIAAEDVQYRVKLVATHRNP